jgi:hypothetical protein
MRCAIQQICWLTSPLREQARSHRADCASPQWRLPRQTPPYRPGPRPARSVQPETYAPPALLRDATGGRDVSSNLPVGVHVTGDLSVFEHLTRAFRRWRRRYRWRGWRTGTASQQHSKKSQRQHAFPKIVHRTTRDEWKSNSREPTDHGRPDHSFFIAERSASASESARSGESGCRFCVRIREDWQIEMCFARQGPSRASSLPQWGEVHPTVIGRLSGRHREQAHSYRKAKANRIRFSPLNRMSVSSAAALDLDPRATSEG